MGFKRFPEDDIERSLYCTGYLHRIAWRVLGLGNGDDYFNYLESKGIGEPQLITIDDVKKVIEMNYEDLEVIEILLPECIKRAKEFYKSTRAKLEKMKMQEIIDFINKGDK